jgi:signal transduction histidine kinase/tetratricopeptide (TPR) repeat protein
LEKLNSLKITLVFIFSIVIPSLLLSFFALRAVSSERIALQSKVEKQIEGLALNLKREIEESFFAPSREAAKVVRELRGKEITPKELVEIFSNLSARGKLFRQLFILDPGANLFYPPKDSSQPALPPRPEQLDRFFLEAERLEFQTENLEGAMEAYRRLLEEYPKNPWIQCECLNSLGRLYLKAGDAPAAFGSYNALLDRYPMGRDRDGTLLSVGARYQIARIWLGLKKETRHHAALLDLLEFLEMHRSLVGIALYTHYRQKILPLLAEVKSPAIQKGLARIRAIAERKREERAFIASFEANFQRNLSDLLVGGQGRVSPAAFMKKRVGTRYDTIFYSILYGNPDEKPRALVGFSLDLGSFLHNTVAKKLRHYSRDGDGHFQIVERVTVPYGTPPGDRTRGEKRLVKALPLAYPLDHWEIRAWLKKASAPDVLADWRSKIYLWAIALCILGIGAGATMTIRTVLREMKVSRLKSDFASSVTHELRTPLTSIGMFLETLLMGRVRDKAEERECLEIMAKETERLRNLIDRVLNFSKIEARVRRFNLKLEDPYEIVEETVRLFRKQIQDESVEIEINRIQNLHRVLVDREAISEVLLNLLSNAYKYNREEKVIKIHLKEKRNQLLIEVEDKGIGIPKSEQRKIFKKFYRCHDLTTQGVEGSGIGLTIALYIARAHRGDIRVQSKLAKGSKFTLVLPKSLPGSGMGLLQRARNLIWTGR